MIAAARRVVVLANHTKVSVDHFARFAAIDDVDVLVTDSGIDAGLALDLDSAGVRVVQA
jgi:DeoR family fructose operon transcriptional repressor